MEGRGLSDMYRNTSEEIFLRSYMESVVGVPVPTTTVDVLGFKNLSQRFRTDSEELFKSWLTNGENTGFNSPSIAHRTRSRRISTEITNLSSQQLGSALQNKRNNDNAAPQYDTVADGFSGSANHNSVRNAVEKGMQASELYMAKAWFHSPQPMTRSRSSELRRRYVAMQSTQTAIGLDTLQNTSARVINVENQDYAYSNGVTNVTNRDFNYPNVLNGHSSAREIPTQVDAFMSPPNSSSSTFNAASMGGEIDKVSSLVSLLKGTLERKKLSKKVIEDDNFVFSSNFTIGQAYPIHEEPSVFPEMCPIQVKDCEVAGMIDASIDYNLEEFVNSVNPIQSSKVSQEPSQSESSTAAPVVSSGFDTCDGPANSGQALSASESSLKQDRNRSSENGSRAKDIRERIIGSLKDDKKRGSLQRHGSVTSAISGDKEDPTKKRRVERSRKMAEAKERNLSPTIPSDMQSVLKRCEMLEKEVRSLKLNLSFMNRKDSEQTKQIEDLQKQNEDLLEEKECLVEEINRIIPENAKIQ